MKDFIRTCMCIVVYCRVLQGVVVCALYKRLYVSETLCVFAYVHV